jgi:DNA-binding PadR family transcriptional regulator
MHGYELMAEIAERTRGVWQPSPGSIYPTLALLQDQGLVVAESSEGSRRTFTLTEAGRRSTQSDGPAPWASVVEAADPAVTELRSALRGVGVAVEQLIEAGGDAHRARARSLLLELRRELYLMLAADQ